MPKKKAQKMWNTLFFDVNYKVSLQKCFTVFIPQLDRF